MYIVCIYVCKCKGMHAMAPLNIKGYSLGCQSSLCYFVGDTFSFLLFTVAYARLGGPKSLGILSCRGRTGSRYRLLLPAFVCSGNLNTDIDICIASTLSHPPAWWFGEIFRTEQVFFVRVTANIYCNMFVSVQILYTKKWSLNSVLRCQCRKNYFLFNFDVNVKLV